MFLCAMSVAEVGDRVTPKLKYWDALSKPCSGHPLFFIYPDFLCTFPPRLITWPVGTMSPSKCILSTFSYQSFCTIFCWNFGSKPVHV